ncbi:FabD/lysophospholipase-like protein [Gloeophyllum trabeum ATCC 11539]|uniref:Lysophospholipase n=1 Tax=Gloeophyllum trabeum (strain ATCC 11539 / FP-39264 / Madison 617) TaxID=670483 RepID=S7Q7I7_GLOTA|nr:FabD/lysophospholipase-like protein [Gloeophyllum trabeum ATCC 11539]EPQ55428.1 FabD/lysophospholipase-like protein [Gloeophyllum trabeum ATCC 11539]
MQRPILALLALALALALTACAETAAQAYTPTTGACPAGFALVRPAGDPAAGQTLSPGEQAYIAAKRADVLPGAFRRYLDTVVRTAQVPLPAYMYNILGSEDPAQMPTVGIASSGGAYRAALFGAGVLNALDARNGSSVARGTGGLLQATSYLAGLSGGSWLVYSLAQANFPTAQELVLGPADPVEGGYGGWVTEWGTLTLYPDSADEAMNEEYMNQTVRDIMGKYEAGWPVSIVDLLSRSMGRHFLNGTTGANFFDNSTVHGAGVLFSDLTNVPTFASREQPFPIVVADGWSKYPYGPDGPEALGSNTPPSNVIYEFNAYEMGSYDPQLAAFAPMQYLGTTNETVCVTGFEQASFIIGGSSDYYSQSNSSMAAIMATAGPWITLVNESFTQPGVQLDVGLVPNPFQGQGNGSFTEVNETYLNIVDGGNDGQAIPIQPLLVKARAVDALIAIDVNAEVNNYATGGDFISSATRAALFPTAYSFPPIPLNTSTFIAENLTLHPTFFGCETPETPLIIYIANGGPPKGQMAVTNTSDDTWTEPLIQAFLTQTFDMATQGYPASEAESTDPEWAACLACAVVDRERERQEIARAGVCESCMARYCWS